ncbi:unnamed protein product [Blepharisma stoltei]|uniref:Palmitoyltransferase n=1 Tax=Blepharisma stoltei TaxID=1481888 RepID=A0AAU9K1G5_9CILI|nr:unnamed protein product [Blepharisma stoltei]
MRPDAYQASISAKVFYIVLHLAVIFIFWEFPSDLSVSCGNFEFSCIFFTVLKITATFLYFICGLKPGFIRTTPMKQEIELLSEEDWQPPPKNYCEDCKILKPYRTRHCYKCEECIAKFDHHCFWIGACVGEMNHFRFALYLIIESICFLWAAYNCLSGISDNAWGFWLYLLSFFLCAGFGMLVTGLGLFHIRLISQGLTTWEVMRKYKIDYLKPYPQNFNPFDEGFINNWRSTICDRELKEWTPPRPRPFYPFNWCENEYWSCC